MISIIIPTYNEVNAIVGLVKHLLANAHGKVKEIIVVDGFSTDKTAELAEQAGAKVIVAEKQGRGCQMNEGALIAKGDLLYFVHADSIPPSSYVSDIYQAIEEGFDLGCYRFKFQSNKLLLKFNSYCTRFDRLMCRGGDQTLFVKKDIFEKLKGYKNDYLIMEEYDFLIRARKKHLFKIIPKDVLVSARKYDNNNYFRVNFANFIVFMMFYAGIAQPKMVKTYKRLINHPKA
jgi:rSAM/selenodomain-associated transferase 2